MRLSQGDYERVSVYGEDPGVVAAGWTSGTYDMERAIRFAAGDWSQAGKLNRDKFTSTLTAIAAKVMGAGLWVAHSGL